MDENLTSTAALAAAQQPQPASLTADNTSSAISHALTFSAQTDFNSDEVFRRGCSTMSADNFRTLLHESHLAGIRPTISTDTATGTTSITTPTGCNTHVARTLHDAYQNGGMTEAQLTAMYYRTAENIMRHNPHLKEGDVRKKMEEATEVTGIGQYVFKDREDADEYAENLRQSCIDLVLDCRKDQFGERIKNTIERRMAEGQYADEFDFRQAYIGKADYTRADITEEGKWNAEMKALKHYEWPKYEEQFRIETKNYKTQDESMNDTMRAFAIWFVSDKGPLAKRREVFGKDLQSYALHLSFEAVKEERMRTGKQDHAAEQAIVDRIMDRKNLARMAEELRRSHGSWEEAMEKHTTEQARKFAKLAEETQLTMSALHEAGKKDKEEKDSAEKKEKEQKEYLEKRAREVPDMERDAKYDAEHPEELERKEELKKQKELGAMERDAKYKAEHPEEALREAELKARDKIVDEEIKDMLNSKYPFLTETKLDTKLARTLNKDEGDTPVLRVPPSVYQQILRSHKAQKGQGISVLINGEHELVVRPDENSKRMELNWEAWKLVNGFDGNHSKNWIIARLRKRHKMKFKIR